MMAEYNNASKPFSDWRHPGLIPSGGIDFCSEKWTKEELRLEHAMKDKKQSRNGWRIMNLCAEKNLLNLDKCWFLIIPIWFFALFKVQRQRFVWDKNGQILDKKCLLVVAVCPIFCLPTSFLIVFSIVIEWFVLKATARLLRLRSKERAGALV